MSDFAAKFALRRKISEYAKSLGFDLVGFSPAKIEQKYLGAFEDWLGEGLHGTMNYMEKIEQRRDLGRILPGAKSVIVLGINYYHEQKPLPSGHGRIARYAYGRDYHKVIGKKLKEIEKFIQTLSASIMPNSILPHRISGNHFPYQMSTFQIRHANSTTKATNLSPEPNLGHCHANCQTKSTTHQGAPTTHRVTPKRQPLIKKVPPILTKSYVDTGPLLERALAEQAGLGRIGKNGCLITEKFGSWIFLSEIITTLDLNFSSTGSKNQVRNLSPGKLLADQTPVTSITSPTSSRWSQTPPGRWSDPSQKSFNVCGNCTRCMTACPTGAIIAPGVVDARLCISYLTIENKDKIPPKLAKIIAKTKRLYGCDICQEVCPHNTARSQPAERKKTKVFDIIENTLSSQSLTYEKNGLFSPIAGDSLNLKTLRPKNSRQKSAIKTDHQFLQTFAGSPLMRAKRKGLLRNAKVTRPTRSLNNA